MNRTPYFVSDVMSCPVVAVDRSAQFKGVVELSSSLTDTRLVPLATRLIRAVAGVVDVQWALSGESGAADEASGKASDETSGKASSEAV